MSSQTSIIIICTLLMAGIILILLFCLIRLYKSSKQPRRDRDLELGYRSVHGQTNILDLPPEMVEMIFQKITATQDVENCSIALAGTRHEEFVTQNYLKPQLKIFASLDLNLKESLKNEGWFEECEDTNLIIHLWKEFKPSLPSMYNFFQSSLGIASVVSMNLKCILCQFGFCNFKK